MRLHQYALSFLSVLLLLSVTRSKRDLLDVKELP